MPTPDSTTLGLPETIPALSADFWALQAKLARAIADHFKANPFDREAWRATLPKKLKILLVTPCDDGHKLCFWNSIRALERAIDEAGHTYEVLTVPGDSLIPRARNNHNHTFYVGSDFDVIGWLDSDLDFRPQDVWKIAAWLLQYPIVAGTYYIKDGSGRPCINTIPGVGPDSDGLLKVATAGTGALFYHRVVVSRMLAIAPHWPHWRMRYIDDQTQTERYHLFHHGVIDDPEFGHTPRDMSEDWSWCYLARKLGFDVQLDTRTVFMHRGEIDYPLNARRLSAKEVAEGQIAQPDGSFTVMAKPEPV